MLARLKGWARTIRRDAIALWLAARDPRVGWGVRLFCMAVAAYALSPIDLIPDVIPILGLLDEAILLPLSMVVAVRLIPAPVMADLRTRAAGIAGRPVSRVAAVVVVALWLMLVVVAGFWLFTEES
jgi:uncharacterized membrane protein YkvA (DUF1232 family)